MHPAHINAVRHLQNGVRQPVTLSVHVYDDGSCLLDLHDPQHRHVHVYSVALNPNAAALLRSYLLEKLPIHRNLSELLSLSDRIN